MPYLTRRQLHELVWTYPVSRISKVLGSTDHLVNKICKEHDISTPSRGYWAKKQTGQAIPRDELLRPEEDPELELELSEKMRAELGKPLVREKEAAPKARTPAPSQPTKKPRPHRGANSPADAPAGVVATPPQFQQTGGPTRNEYPRPESLACSDWNQVLQWARRLDEVDCVERFMRRVIECASSTDPKTMAVSMFLAELIRRKGSQNEPVAAVVEVCRRVAHGLDAPEWWAAWDPR